MKTQCVIVLLLGLFPLIITGQQTAQRCEQDVNGCTAEFSLAQQVQSQSGFNLSAICSIVDEFMTCVNTVLAPCDVITKNTLRSAIDQLIGIYTNPPYGCTLNFAETFEYGNCSQQVTQCAFFKYAAEELKDNATEACKEFDGFVECMELNTTTCVGAEQTEIVQSIQNTTNTFNQCPYACNRPDLVCTTVTATTTPAPATTTTSTTTTVRPTTTKATVKQQPTSTVDTTTTATTTTTTDFPTPNYDNAAVVKQVSAITVLASLVLAMMS
ncbi:bypass of stop codon protein 1-like isoform X4 [Haliotis rufescens]|uniref:bypass of stop codon protein 1-like isoform X4 n=1 Tax=Haliotis rufescens TaxID=6454 RepID=UPI00201EB4BE|nr:bypass of stop codon protein 1-like isoform X4 [Haliotis rufescens]